MENVNVNNYQILRQKIVDQNTKLISLELSDDEKLVDEKLTSLKKEYIASFENEKVPYNMPVLRQPKISNSRLYDFCMKLPKGSDLHVHGTCLLPMEKLIDFISRNDKLFIGLDDYKLSLTKDDKHIPLKQALQAHLIEYDTLFKTWTIEGVKHKENRWDYFENLFSYFEAIDQDYDVLYQYYLEAFEYYCSLNIGHVEIHLLIDESYTVAYQSVLTIRKAYYEIKKNHPNFTCLVIGSAMKQFDYNIQYVINVMDNCAKLMDNIKDDYDPRNVRNFIVGFDLINEEDTSRPLMNYAIKLLEFKSYHPSFNYFLHSGESLEPESNNLIDAYLLGAKRVGHGLNLYQYPLLLNNYVDSEICLEVCPISNQTLGYTKNIRNHPFYEYIKRGVIVSLCSDDPIFFEKNSLVDDFMAMIVCFNLNLADIKQLCINSIMYSSFSQRDILKKYDEWKNDYDEFIQGIT